MNLLEEYKAGNIRFRKEKKHFDKLKKKFRDSIITQCKELFGGLRPDSKVDVSWSNILYKDGKMSMNLVILFVFTKYELDFLRNILPDMKIKAGHNSNMSRTTFSISEDSYDDFMALSKDQVELWVEMR